MPQFLNVIESVFSGMARAIIHNSDYQSVEEAMQAIDRHFEERNEAFRKNPRREARRYGGKNESLPFSPKAITAKTPGSRDSKWLLPDQVSFFAKPADRRTAFRAVEYVESQGSTRVVYNVKVIGTEPSRRIVLVDIDSNSLLKNCWRSQGTRPTPSG